VIELAGWAVAVLWAGAFGGFVLGFVVASAFAAARRSDRRDERARRDELQTVRAKKHRAAAGSRR
jgi:membrane associated rhomboid family serine protease